MASSAPKGSPQSPEELWRLNEEYIRSLAERLSYVRPEYADPKHFIGSTFSRAYEKFIKRVHTFDGRNWDGWLYRLVRSAAGDEVRSIVGRHANPPVFVDADDVDLVSLWNAEAELRSAEHAAIVLRLLEIHSQQSIRGLKSAEAISGCAGSRRGQPRKLHSNFIRPKIMSTKSSATITKN
jgi:hypothetical protein